MTLPIHAILDLDRYPLDQPDGRAFRTLVSEKRDAWRTQGAWSLPGLVRPEALHRVAAELTPLIETAAFRHRNRHNIYFTDDIADLPEDLARKSLSTASWTLTCDQMAGSLIRAVYEWDPLRAFIQTVLDLPALYRMVDPMACLNVMAYGDGDLLDWHFDRAKFAVTLSLQTPDGGGQFQYRRNLRSTDDPNYDGVRRLLEGRDDQVREAPPSAGQMTVFAGFGSAHRVAPIEGARHRMMAVLSYMEEPDYLYSEEDRMRFYGRPHPDAPAVQETTP